MSSYKKHKIVIAAGGSGGHLLPAQNFAEELLRDAPSVEILFAGVGLSTNRYFQKERFAYEEVEGATLFKKNPISAFFKIFKGIRQSVRLLKKSSPQLVIGFGSFHSFPLLVAALFCRIPYLLFEPNLSPGKVNQLMSRFAAVSAVVFPATQERLLGPSTVVQRPMKKEAREDGYRYFGLDAGKKTLLVFGGSQGALALNEALRETAPMLEPDFQILHFTGKATPLQEVRSAYAQAGLSACVKEFEERMDLAWSIASFAICRAGAGTIAEALSYEVPSLLIPYPYAYDHQTENALFMEREVGGACHLPQKELSAVKLLQYLKEMQEKSQEMRSKLKNYNQKGQVQSLSALVLTHLKS